MNNPSALRDAVVATTFPKRAADPISARLNLAAQVQAGRCRRLFGKNWSFLQNRGIQVRGDGAFRMRAACALPAPSGVFVDASAALVGVFRDFGEIFLGAGFGLA